MVSGGATQAAGGVGSSALYNGSELQGAGYSSCLTDDLNDSGGGGGGYYGGGVYNNDGVSGGGGSGYLHPTLITDGSMSTATTNGSSVTSQPPSTGDSDYAAPHGTGGTTSTNGGSGRVIIRW